MKKETKSLADVLKTSAVLWLGKTNIPNQDMLLFITSQQIHFSLVEHTDTSLVLYSLHDTNLLSTDIYQIMYVLFPEYKGLNLGKINITSLPNDLEILGDYNEDLYHKGIKVLSESRVKPFLDSLGVDTSKYTYTKISVDNTHTLTQSWSQHGYTKYTPDVLSVMSDVSKYKTYTMDKQDEYEMMDMGCYTGMIAAGPAGTGKSTDPLIYCAKEEIPVLVFQCTPGTEEDSIIGNFVPTKSGGYILKRGPLAMAIEQDCWIVINEANYAPAGIISCLNSVMDDNAQVLLADGTMLHRGPNFRLILTVNPGYKGTNMFNEATLNRFVTVYYPPITKEVLIQRLQLETGYKNSKVLEVIAEQFDKLRDIYLSRNMDTEVTYRNTLHFINMLLLAPKVAIEKQFDMAFINNTVFEMSSISEELLELQNIRTDMINSITNVLNEGTSNVKEGTLSFIPAPDLDGLDELMDDSGVPLDIEKEEE